MCRGREYTAPEYTDIYHGPVSTKSDVFSFGMLILKTISGCRKYNDSPTANENFVQYVSMFMDDQLGGAVLTHQPMTGPVKSCFILMGQMVK